MEQEDMQNNATVADSSRAVEKRMSRGQGDNCARIAFIMSLCGAFSLFCDVLFANYTITHFSLLRVFYYLLLCGVAIMGIKSGKKGFSIAAIAIALVTIACAVAVYVFAQSLSKLTF